MKVKGLFFEFILIILSIFPFTPQIFHSVSKTSKKPVPSVKVPAGFFILIVYCNIVYIAFPLSLQISKCYLWMINLNADTIRKFTSNFISKEIKDSHGCIQNSNTVWESK